MTSPPTTLPALHPLEEVAKRYNLSLRSLQEKARKKRFTHIKIGGTRFMTDEQLRAFLHGSTVRSQRDQDLAATRDRVNRRTGTRVA